ncbi:MAG TPA: S16 family serine protease, partial [Limnochordia bacterium]|nr:S16 family serine protease [Limnochordia bacterium]
HYLEVPYDLSKVIFITTANQLEPIPGALRDRMEVIPIAGYTDEEKLEIAKRFLVPKQLETNGLQKKQARFPDKSLLALIRGYTSEAGVRNLEREIASVCRKLARRLLDGEAPPFVVAADDLDELLGPARFDHQEAESADEIGVATGVAVTQTGGDVMTIEAALVPGKGNLVLTGSLGDVMKESAQAALTYARSRLRDQLAAGFFEGHDIHVHVPEGAVPKDGPSAGAAIASALVSILTATPIAHEVAMTGEVTLRGRILPVGGIKEKALAAARAGIKRFLLPKKNEKDLAELPESVTKRMEIVTVSHMDEVIERALATKRTRSRKAQKAG